MNGIRAMTADDRDCVLAMMRVFYASPAVLSGGSEEIFERDFAACIGESPYVEGYVFTSGPETAGYAMAAKSFSTEFGRPCVWIEDLYIRPEFRGRGCGSRFFRFIEGKYPDAVLRLEVTKTNETAIRLYEKCGYRTLPYLGMKKSAR